MMHAIDETLVARARELGPLIREHAASAERERRLAKPVFDALNRAGFTKMMLPKSLGGLETDPITILRVMEEIASADSVAAWLLMVSNSAAFTGCRYPTETVETLCADPDDWIIATAFQPPIVAREVDGGYVLDGRRPLASFAHAARWICMTAIVMDGPAPRMVDGNPVIVVAIMPAKDVEVLDTWHGLGLRGSDSTDVAVHELFVPRAFTSPLVPPFEPNAHYRSALYRLPLLAAVGLATFPPIALAIARNAIDEVRALSDKRVPMASTVPLAARGVAQARLGRAEAMYRSARAFLYETMAETWEKTQAGERSTLEERAAILLAAAHAVQASAEIVDAMFTSAGSSGVYTRHPMERLFRDAQVIRQHGFVAASRYETVAQALLGLPPDLPMIHF